jgi:hypothetical protein
VRSRPVALGLSDFAFRKILWWHFATPHNFRIFSLSVLRPKILKLHRFSYP